MSWPLQASLSGLGAAGDVVFIGTILGGFAGAIAAGVGAGAAGGVGVAVVTGGGVD